MTNSSDIQTADATLTPVSNPVSNARTRKLTTPDDASKWNLSSCGKWRSSKVHAGLMQYIPSGIYYARAKVNGIVKRASLDTDTFTTAKDRLAPKIKELRTPAANSGTFGEYLEKFKTKTENDASLSEEGKKYRLRCAGKLEESWPKLRDTQLSEITPDDVEKWWNKFSKEYNPQFVNHTLVYFRYILRKLAKHAIDPSVDISPVGVKPKKLTLPSTEQFQAIVAHVRSIRSRNGGVKNESFDPDDSADMIEFMAYSGCRISEAQQVLWRDVDMESGQIRVPCAKRRRSSREDDFRIIPMIPPMKLLLERVKTRRNPKPEDRVNVLESCKRSLTNACKHVKAPRLTHHDLRHLFASVCIESKVPIETLSRWLGHSDGGSLAQRIYGHLRQEHSVAMAQKVTFGMPELPANAIPLVQAVAAK